MNKSLSVFSIVIGILFFFTASQVTAEESVITKKMKEAVQDIEKKIGDRKHFLRLDYMPCTDFKGKASEYTKQVTDQFLSVLTGSFTVVSLYDRMYIVKQNESTYQEYLGDLHKLHKQHIDREEANGLIECKVGPKAGSLMDKKLFSVKAIIYGGETVQTTVEWFDM